MRAPKPDFKRTLVPEGTYLARVYKIIYLGTQKSKMFGNESFKVRINWELPTELHAFKEGDPEKPFSIDAEYTVSMGKKSNLRPVVEALIGVQLKDEEAYAFDVDEILGLPCQITVTHTEDGQYANVSAVSQLLKGVTCPPQVNKSVILNFDEKWDDELFKSLPEFIRRKIESSPEFKKMKGLDVVDESEVPF